MRYLFLLFCGLLLTVRASAQDVLLLTDGRELIGKVLTITPELVTYASPTDTLRLAATQVFLIRYANGTKEVFQRPAAATTAPAQPMLSKEAAYTQGRRDAKTYFRAPGVFWGTYGATVVTAGYGGVGGLATGLATSLTPPKVRNIPTSDPALLNNPNYIAGYQRQAQNKKIGSAAGGFGAGVGTLVVLVAVIISAIGVHHI